VVWGSFFFLQAHHALSQWCWSPPVQVVLGGAGDVSGVTLAQMGYLMPVHTSHATPAVATLQVRQTPSAARRSSR